VIVDITSKTEGNVLWIKIAGPMVLDASLFRLREQVMYGLEAGVTRFVIDLSEVSHLDSSGCGQVISAYTSVQRANGRLIFVNPSERVRAVWAHTKLNEVLSICSTLDEARGLVLQ
jgi:anti-sigma B factor antagonist